MSSAYDIHGPALLQIVCEGAHSCTRFKYEGVSICWLLGTYLTFLQDYLEYYQVLTSIGDSLVLFALHPQAASVWYSNRQY